MLLLRGRHSSRHELTLIFILACNEKPLVLLDSLVQRATRALVLICPLLLRARDELVDRVRARRVRDEQAVRPVCVWWKRRVVPLSVVELVVVEFVVVPLVVVISLECWRDLGELVDVVVVDLEVFRACDILLVYAFLSTHTYSRSGRTYANIPPP